MNIETSSTTSSNHNTHEDDKLTQVVEQVLADLTDSNESPEDRIRAAKRNLTEYVQNVCQALSMKSSNKSQSKLFPSKLLSVADSLDLIPHDHRVSKSTDNIMVQIQGNHQMLSNCSSTFVPHYKPSYEKSSEKSVKIKLVQEPRSAQQLDIDEMRKRHLVALQLQSDEYLRTFHKEPPYMRPTSKRTPFQQLSLWKYKVTTAAEWDTLWARVEKAAIESRSEKHVRVDDTESLTVATIAESSIASDSTVLHMKNKSILRRVEETDTSNKEPEHERFKVATLLERLERGSGVVDKMTREFSSN